MKQKIRNLICGLSAVGLLAGCSSERHLESKAKISKGEAQRIALSKAPGGTIKEGELEKEHGKLIWSFDIAQSGTSDITEVQVDAITGGVVSIENESAEKEAKEKMEEEKEHKHEKGEKEDDEKENK